MEFWDKNLDRAIDDSFVRKDSAAVNMKRGFWMNDVTLGSFKESVQWLLNYEFVFASKCIYRKIWLRVKRNHLVAMCVNNASVPADFLLRIDFI